MTGVLEFFEPLNAFLGGTEGSFPGMGEGALLSDDAFPFQEALGSFSNEDGALDVEFHRAGHSPFLFGGGKGGGVGDAIGSLVRERFCPDDFVGVFQNGTSIGRGGGYAEFPGFVEGFGGIGQDHAHKGGSFNDEISVFGELVSQGGDAPCSDFLDAGGPTEFLLECRGESLLHFFPLVRGDAGRGGKDLGGCFDGFVGDFHRCGLSVHMGNPEGDDVGALLAMSLALGFVGALGLYGYFFVIFDGFS